MNWSKDMDAQVKEGVSLVDFWAPWCGPCRLQGTILERVEQAAGPGVRVGKVNVDEAPELAARFGIRSIPTLIVFRDGRPVQQFVGVQSDAVLLAALHKAAA